MQTLAPRQRKRRPPLIAAFTTLLVFATGCAILFPPDKPFVVDDSQLNWMTVRYRPASRQRQPCTLSLYGAGYIRVIAGKSPLVADSFAVNTEHERWGDAHEEKIGMSPAEARGIMQLFADAGLMSEPPRPPKDQAVTEESLGVAVFRCRINGEPFACMTMKSQLTDLLDALLDQVGFGPAEPQP